MKDDWQEPFLKLKAGLRSLFDANISVYHAVMLSTNRSEEELLPSFGMLEPAYLGKKLANSIVVDTDGCTYHGHLFFADKSSDVDQLGRLLNDIEAWVANIPPKIVPVAFEIPSNRNQAHRNILRWVALVYYLAWVSEAPYLDVELEFQESVDRIGFFPWYECPQPPGCLPFEWLIHQGSAKGRIPEWQQSFELRGERLPDVIDAYLIGDLIACSLAAVDILAYVLNFEKRKKSVENEDYAKKLKENRPKTKKVDREVTMLQIFLAGWHLNKPVTISKKGKVDPSQQTEDPFKPLTQKQIATWLNWITPQGNFDLSKVNHRMEAIFGPDPMDKYKDSLTSSDRKTQYSDMMKNGLHASERFTESKTATRPPTSKLPDDDDDDDDD